MHTQEEFSRFALKMSSEDSLQSLQIHYIKDLMQPLSATGIVKEAAFQSGIRLASVSRLPSEEVAFTEDMLLSASWSVQSKTTLRRQRRVFTQILQELCSRLQPLQKRLKMSAVPHQHNLIDTNVALVTISMYSSKWPVNMLPTRLPQGRNLMSTIAATAVLEDSRKILHQ